MMKSGPRLPQLEKALTQKRRPNTAKNKNKLINLKKKKTEAKPFTSKKITTGTSLVVQRLTHRASKAGDMGSIPGWGTKIPHAVQCGQKQKQKQKDYNLLKAQMMASIF